MAQQQLPSLITYDSIFSCKQHFPFKILLPNQFSVRGRFTLHSLQLTNRLGGSWVVLIWLTLLVTTGLGFCTQTTPHCCNKKCAIIRKVVSPVLFFGCCFKFHFRSVLIFNLFLELRFFSTFITFHLVYSWRKERVLCPYSRGYFSISSTWFIFLI